MSAFNCGQRRDRYIEALDKSFSTSSSKRCLYVGDTFLLPLLILDRYPNIELFILQSANAHLAHTLQAILANSSSDLKYHMISSLEKSDIDLQSIDTVLSEPFFTKSILPWDNLHFYYLLQPYRSHFRSDCQVFPRRARIRCIALEFEHLHKIRSPVGHCREFDLTPFDEQIMQAALEVDAAVEPQSLFEYSSKRPTLSAILDLIEIDFRENYTEKVERRTLEIPFKAKGVCNGIAFWIDYELHENIWLTTGIDDETKPWVTFSKQGVHLLPRPFNVQSGMKLTVSAGFDFQQGQFLFDILRDQKI